MYRMKKLLFVFLIGALCGSVSAQTLTKEQFLEIVIPLEEAGNEAEKNKDFRKWEQSMLEMLSCYGKLSSEDAKEYSHLPEYLWYDIACARSLSKKKKAAVDAFEKAVENGYTNYHHMLSDSDLDNIRNEKRMKELIQQIREKGDYLYILGQSAPYEKEDVSSLPVFTYPNPNDPDLVRVREYFNLDSIAGSGNEISKIKNLLEFVHDAVRHDGNSYNPTLVNAIDIYEICRKEDRGVNCRMMGIMLNECYLAMGFKARYVTCMPKEYESDCHVINVVYSVTLDKWLWVDPTNNAYVMDEEGNMLSIAEVRERMKNEEPLVLNADANWNRKEPQVKEHHLDKYMAKNLYYIVCPTTYNYNQETRQSGPVTYVGLVPSGFEPGSSVGGAKIYTADDEYFWQSPYQ